MGIGFFMWSMHSFNEMSFALCGKTITSVRRNVADVVLPQLEAVGFRCDFKISKNLIDVFCDGRHNRFYLFGGKDESSASLIQGMTLAGVLFDEVVLMPRSFVEQALARCSVAGSKLWFNCNPESPHHWFYTEWIKKRRAKNVIYLSFTMADNPSLSENILRRYRTLYSGAFYDRFVLGKWTAATGLVYPMFDPKTMVASELPCFTRYVVSADYGTVNPSSFGVWGFSLGVWYRVKEYYYSSKETGKLRTDEEHYSALEELCAGLPIDFVVIDPSAASFIECIRRHGKFHVQRADNNVLDGIRRVSDALKSEKIRISSCCKDILREFSLYVWDEKCGNDCPVKENDHAMDDMRYFVNTVMTSSSEFFVGGCQR